jgi:hypothetical protein
MKRERLLGFATVALVSLVVGHGIAAAQAQTAPPPDASAGLARQVTLSPAEQLAQSETFLARMEGARSSVRRQLETARTQRDVVKTLCLNDKLTQLDVAIRSARERRQGLELAVKRRDTDLSNHEFTILTVLRQRSEQLTAEANQCIGQEAGFIGDSAVTATIDPNLPKEDPSDYPVNENLVEPPACSSCFQ